MIGRFLPFSALLMAAQGIGAAEPAGRYVVTESAAATAVVEIDAADAADYRISPALFGKFSENLGNNVYGGLWAQVLVNPSLEPIEDCIPTRAYSLIRRSALRRMAGEDIFAGGGDARPAYGWFDWNGGPANVRSSSDAFNTSRSIELTLDTLPAGADAIGIRQPVYLPLHREREYRLSVHVKGATAPIIARIGSATSPSRILAEATLAAAPDGGWQELRGELVVESTGAAEGEALWFCLGLDQPGRALIDQVTLWPADEDEGLDPEVVEALRDYGVTLLRFPGGNYVSGYHWKDDLSPLEARPTRPNPAWNDVDPHHVGTDEYMALCRQLGAEPLICVNAGDGTAEEAADWVEYCNGPVTSRWGRLRAERGHPEPYGVRTWEVGNELWGEWQVGHCTPEEYARRYDAFARAMRARDPSIRLIACGHHDPAWNRVLLEQATEKLEMVSVHLLFFNNANGSPLYSYLSQIGYSHFTADLFRDMRRQGLERGVDWPIAVTELIGIGGARNYQAGPTRLSEALFFTGVFNAAVRAEGDVELLTYTGAINHGGGLRREMGRVYRTPVVFARRELGRLAGMRPVAVRATCRFADVPEWQPGWMGNEPRRFPLLDALAARDGDRLTVVLVNREPERATPVEMRLGGFAPAGAGTRFELTGDSFMAANDAANPDRVRPTRAPLDWPRGAGSIRLDLPPHSVTILTFDGKAPQTR